VDAPFLVAVGAALGLVSVMMALRLASGGAGFRPVAIIVAELWVTAAAWVALFWWLSSAMNAPVGGGSMGGLGDLPARLAGLSFGAQAAAATGVVICAGLVVHLMAKLSRPTKGRGGC
jgi:uncharacterized membrane-anchored protein